MSDRLRVSAVVCTRNRTDYLLLCLNALERQTLPASEYEVIVVESPTAECRDVVASYTERNGNFRYIHEEKPGISVARNVGVRASATNIVAFTDDDAEPEATWLERIANRFEELPDDVAIVGGDCVPVWEAERPAWLSDPLLRPLSAGLKWSTDARFLRAGEWLFEGNTGYNKKVLLKVGGFPEHLGRYGNVLLSGESACHVLMERAGYRLYYDPAILIHHHIPANRLNKTWFRRRSFWQGVSVNLFHRYVEESARKLGLPEPARHTRAWEEIPVPISPTAWANLFDDRSTEDFGEQLLRIEQLGYLFESQSVVIGR